MALMGGINENFGKAPIPQTAMSDSRDNCAKSRKRLSAYNPVDQNRAAYLSIAHQASGQAEVCRLD
jgi:hypothetical protein